MAQRALTDHEKYQLSVNSDFVGTLQLAVVKIAKYWYDFAGTAEEKGITVEQLSQMKTYSSAVYKAGGVPEMNSFALLWLSIYNGAVEIPEPWDVPTLVKTLSDTNQFSGTGFAETIMKLKAYG